MSLFAIADLHLSTLDSTNKSMEVFGRRWEGYMTRLKNNWLRLVGPDDTVVIPGDISWALTLEEAISDLKFIDSLPGKKILGKGNHDFWWTSMKKHAELFEKEGINSISFLFNNAFIADGIIVAGTRGWYHDPDAKNAPDGVDFEKLTRREGGRLRASLEAARALKLDNPDCPIVAFMHFPLFWSGKASEELIEILKEYGVKRVYYGHIHGNYTVSPTISYDGIEMTMISADYLGFTPLHINRALCIGDSL